MPLDPPPQRRCPVGQHPLKEPEKTGPDDDPRSRFYSKLRTPECLTYVGREGHAERARLGNIVGDTYDSSRGHRERRSPLSAIVPKPTI